MSAPEQTEKPFNPPLYPWRNSAGGYDMEPGAPAGASRSGIMRDCAEYFEDLSRKYLVRGDVQTAIHWAHQAASLRQTLIPKEVQS